MSFTLTSPPFPHNGEIPRRFSAFQRSASKPAGQDSVSVFDDEDELRGQSVNVRYGSKADIRRYPLERPLLGAKRTLVRG